MARAKRDTLKRSAAQIYLRFDTQIAETLELKLTFEEYHPELAAALDVVLEACMAGQAVMTKFWQEAWGQDKPRWKSWI